MAFDLKGGSLMPPRIALGITGVEVAVAAAMFVTAIGGSRLAASLVILGVFGTCAVVDHVLQTWAVKQRFGRN